MAFQNEPVIEKMTRNGNAYFTVHWSLMQEGDKYRINASVPAMSGIYELYFKDPYGKLVLYQVDYVWYGGLRSRLRTITDPELEEDLTKRAFIEKKKFFFRFSLSRSFKDMEDVVFFSARQQGYRRRIGAPIPEDSGRYTSGRHHRTR